MVIMSSMKEAKDMELSDESVNKLFVFLRSEIPPRNIVGLSHNQAEKLNEYLK
jgi:hypothetical protein